MTRLPTEASLQALIDSARALHQKPRDRRLPDPTLLAAIERRLLRAVSRDRTGTAERDGYPMRTLVDGGGSKSNGSSTEANALAEGQRDRHHELTLLAIEHLEQLVHQRNLLESALNSIDYLTSDLGPAPRTCAACTGHRPLSGDKEVYRRGTAGNRLERDIDLCEDCYSFVRQTALPNSYAGRLPTLHEIAYHDQRGRWRLRITA